MKQRAFTIIVLTASVVISVGIYYGIMGQADKDSILHTIYAGGPLVMGLITLSLLTITYTFERLFSLNKAQGKGDIAKFLSTIMKSLTDGKVEDAIKACDVQRGSLANIVRSGLSRYQEIKQDNSMDKKAKIAEVKRVIEESTMLEMPILEKNLVSLSTIASVSTMWGLLGTVLGMIRSFAALAKSGGGVDAAQLSLGISEALINTALGIGTSFFAIVFYNFFTTIIDGITFSIDESGFTLTQSFASSYK